MFKLLIPILAYLLIDILFSQIIKIQQKALLPKT